MQFTEEEKAFMDAEAERSRKQMEEENKAYREAHSGLSGFVNDVGDAVGGGLDWMGTAAQSAANSATFGLGGLSERYLGGGIDYLTNNPNDASYDEFVDMYRKRQQERREEYPIASMAGEAGGSVVGALVGGTGVGKLGYDLAARGTNALLGRLSGSSVVGAAENLGTEIGKGTIADVDDAARAANQGLLFGAGGQAAGEALSLAKRGAERYILPITDDITSQIPGVLGNVSRRARDERAMTEAGLELFTDARSASPNPRMVQGTPPLSRTQLGDAARKAEADNTIMALEHEELGDIAAFLARSPKSTGGTDVLGKEARSILDQMDTVPSLALEQRLLKGTEDAVDVMARRQYMKATLNRELDTLLDDPTELINLPDLEAILARSFPEGTMSKPASESYEALRKYIESPAIGTPSFNSATGGPTKTFNARQLSEIKNTLDDIAGPKYGINAKVTDKGTRKMLTSARSNIDDILKREVEGYEDLMQKYVDDHVAQDAIDMAKDHFTLKGRTITPAERIAEFESLPDPAKDEYKLAMLHQLATEVMKGDKKVLENIFLGDNQKTRLFEVAFGKKLTGELKDELLEFASKYKTSANIKKALDARNRMVASGDPSSSPLEKLIGIAGIGDAVLRGTPINTGTGVHARKLSRESVGTKGQALLDLAQSKGKPAQNLMDEMYWRAESELARRANPNEYENIGGALGSGIGSILEDY